MNTLTWHEVCAVDDLEVNWGEAILIAGQQYAIFRTQNDSIFISDHHDPATKALVMARGIIGEKEGCITITSPLHKEEYRLDTGECFSDSTLKLPVFPTKIEEEKVYLGLPA